MEDPFEPACLLADLAAGQIKGVRLSFGNILLCHTGSEIFAIAETCPHEEVSLSTGCLQGDTIRCALHGSRFDLHSGLPLEEPAEDPLVRYPVRIEHEQIWVSAQPI